MNNIYLLRIGDTFNGFTLGERYKVVSFGQDSYTILNDSSTIFIVSFESLSREILWSLVKPKKYIKRIYKTKHCFKKFTKGKVYEVLENGKIRNDDLMTLTIPGKCGEIEYKEGYFRTYWLECDEYGNLTLPFSDTKCEGHKDCKKQFSKGFKSENLKDIAVESMRMTDKQRRYSIEEVERKILYRNDFTQYLKDMDCEVRDYDFFNTKTKETNTMKIETVTMINDEREEAYSNDDLIKSIKSLKATNKELFDADIESTTIKAMIKENADNVNKLISILDNRKVND